MEKIKTATEIRIEFYGENDARSYYPDEIKLMETYYNQFNISDEEIENELSLLTPQSKGFYFEQRLFGVKWYRDKIFKTEK